MVIRKLLFVFILLSSLTACVNKPHEVSNDEINNKYYYDYVAMYKAYDSIPKDSTLAVLKRYLVKFPNNHQAWAFLGRVYIDLHQNAEAENAYRKALSYKPNYGPAMAGLGSMYSWDGRNDSALILINKAVSLGDSTTYNFLNLAIIHIKKGDTAAAQKANSFFVKLDSVDKSTAVYLVAVNKELKNDNKVAALQASLLRQGIKDSLLDLYLEGKLKAVDFFNKKRGS